MFRVLFGLTIFAMLLVMVAAPTAPPAQAQSCGTAPAPRLAVGQTGRVTVGEGIGNNLRASASSTATVLGVMPDGEIFSVLDGPQCVSDYYWWQVRRLNGQTGWTVEGSAGEYWLEPWPIANATLAQGKPPVPDYGTLAFLSSRDTPSEVYVMAADGSRQTRVSNTPGQDTEVTWSPDGTRVTFTDEHDIYVVGTDGLNKVNLTNTPAVRNSWPVWSPDGTRLVFVSDRDGNPEIYVMNTTGGTPTRLTNLPAVDAQPSWSPDGTRIVFASDRDGDPDVYVMNADGTNVLQLTNAADADQFPVWSPTTNQIAYLGSRSGNMDLYLINADSTGDTQLTATPGNEYWPAFSPDGTRIAYLGQPQAGAMNTQLYSIRTDSADPVQYTSDQFEIRNFDWSPDGQWIAFTSNRTGNFDVYVMPWHGGGVANLTNSLQVDETNVVWAPKPGALPPGTTPASTPASSTSAGGANPAVEDLLLIYDATVPVFSLVNVAKQPVNLTPLSFTGAGLTVPATVWQSDYLSSKLDAFMAGGCLMIWRFGLPQQAPPPECGTARQGWVQNETAIFWTQGSFNVLYNGQVVQTCDVAAGRCVVDLP